MNQVIRVCFLLPLVAALASCNGSSGGPVDVNGVWTGTLNPGSSVAYTGAFIADRPGFLYGEDGNLYVVDGLHNTTPLSGQMLLLNAPAVTCAQGSICSDRFLLAGTGYADLLVLSARPLASPDVVGPQQYGITLTRTWPYTSALYFPPGFIFDNAGQWQGYYLTSNLAVSLSVDAAGDFTGSDAYGCSLSGFITQIGVPPLLGPPNNPHPENLFEITLNGVMDLQTLTCTANLSGAGYLSSTGTGPFKGVPGTYFFMAVYDPHAFDAVPPADFDLGYMVELKVK